MGGGGNRAAWRIQIVDGSWRDPLLRANGLEAQHERQRALVYLRMQRELHA